MSRKNAMNSTGSLSSKTKHVDNSFNYITPNAPNLQSAPLFYIRNGNLDRVNTIYSPFMGNSYAVLKFGSMPKKGNMYPIPTSLLNPRSISVNQKGNYIYIDDYNKSHKIYNNKFGSYIKSNNRKLYFSK